MKAFLTMSLIVLLTTSCMKSTKEKSAQLTQREKAPKSLVSIMEGVDQVLDSTKDIEKILKLTLSEFKVQYTDTKPEKDRTQDSKLQENRDVHGEVEKGTDEIKIENEIRMIKDEKILKLWKTIDDRMDRVHKDWNNYESEAVKKGANLEKCRDLKEKLNLLTVAIENRDIISTMNSGSKTLYSLSYFFDLYKDEVSGDLSRISYIAYQAYLKSRENNIKEADELLETAEEYITRVRAKVDKDKIKSLDKLSLSIEDMKQSLKDDSIKVWEIKRDIILENIKQLQK